MLETQKAEALALNRKAIGYRALERDAASNRQIFESLLQRTKETTISGELKTNSIRITDAADMPRSPVWPQKRRNFLFAICAGALLGIVLAFFVEYMDNKIKTPDDIKWDLGVTCLGMVPKIDYKPSKGGSPLLNNGVPPNFSEAFRSLRTNVLFSVNGGMINSLVVTSTAPGEGKTLIASNLAVGFALAGQRVLLMDADMRRPRVHVVFGVPQEPGLSDLMIDQGRIVADVVRKSSVPNLWVLPAGRLPPNPAELLSSRRFNKFLEKVQEQFDWVVIDSPPVMAVTDASILAHLASGVLFVTAADVTNRPAAVRAMEQLAAAKAKLIGAVLNRADVAAERVLLCTLLPERVPGLLHHPDLILRRRGCRRCVARNRAAVRSQMRFGVLIADGGGVRNFLLGSFLHRVAAMGPVTVFHQDPRGFPAGFAVDRGSRRVETARAAGRHARAAAAAQRPRVRAHALGGHRVDAVSPDAQVRRVVAHARRHARGALRGPAVRVATADSTPRPAARAPGRALRRSRPLRPGASRKSGPRCSSARTTARWRRCRRCWRPENWAFRRSPSSSAGTTCPAKAASRRPSTTTWSGAS